MSRYSAAHKRATMAYQKANLDQINLRYPKGTRSMIQDHAALTGESMAAFILRAVTETMDRDKERIAQLMRHAREAGAE